MTILSILIIVCAIVILMVPPYCSRHVTQRDMLFTLYRAYIKGEFKGDI